MSPATDNTTDVLILDTGLYEDSATLAAALAAMNSPNQQRRSLAPATMNDSDWDDILDLVLSAKRVITL